ncbi:class I SAM-dependent methyltransferase [Dolichospermum planctonicum CS-1226]|uniref:Class I SAM-dependent methyltransferase n=1 Tax=Dolichospermum planctonicum CS-1226 TaxID=3021751 RepID=A0ABT5AHK9_9CYAN|nr:class I SAM-dependent methyltransferase [Dolichospermum planctonicum]MDB9536233.1 class I SAM-dependent methyltransferase [Dolichospermum planctonicum CS-1226]
MSSTRMPKSKLLERTISGLHDNLLQSLPTLSYETPVVDIGCGTGAWLNRLSNFGFKHLQGIDLDIDQFGTEKATCSQANLDYDDLGLGERKFGLITAIEVIKHLENPGRILYHVARHLDNNGYFLLTTPNIHSLSCRFKFLATGKLASFDEKGDQTHIYPVLLDCLNRVLPRHSLKIVQQWGYPTTDSLKYRPSTQMISRFLKLFIASEIEGDTLCMLIQKQQ